MERGSVDGARTDTHVPRETRDTPALTRPTAHGPRPTPPDWHALPAVAVPRDLGVDAARGLAVGEARARLATVGPNVLVRARPVTFWRVARGELTEPLILLLLAVGVVYAVWGAPGDALAIFLIIGAIVGIELVVEFRAKRAVAALTTLAPPRAAARRDGRAVTLAAADLVPGDVVLLRAGERVPADLRLLTSHALAADESALTGESAPVEKDATAALAPETPLAERATMAYAGTVVVRGSGRAVVVATGLDTELGRIAGLVEAAREPRTPLQLAMRALSGSLVKVALAFSVLVPLVGVLLGQPPRTMILTGMTLAFATIPEELPIIITLVLGLGALALARRGALVRRLRAAEAVGATTVLCVDKTGTLTENRLAVAALEPVAGAGADDLLRAAALATEP
ncbi:MAG TPA: HAD-IC family P-type ATPase, partial [Thermomicrobiales bacterium]|nr:HAD-IC family P-type ATPase [Thermomicrobiales bacterium]